MEDPMSKEEKAQENRELGVMFPGEEVDIEGGAKLTVRPLSLEDLPKVIKAFSELMEKVEAKVSPTALAIDGMLDLLEILPFCVDKPPKEIPVAKLPDILEIIIKQNITDAVVEKWMALIPRVTDLLGLSVVSKAVTDQGEKEKKA
jgi:hypothetical protein